MQIMPLVNFGGHQLPYNGPTPSPELVPLVREPSPLVATPVSRVGQEPHEVLVERVREVVPDVLPAHVFSLLDQHKGAFSGIFLDTIIHNLLEDPSYPKDLKGKGKERAAKENLLENLGDVDTSIDYANFDANRSRGPVYRGLCLVRLSLAPPCNAVCSRVGDSNIFVVIFRPLNAPTSMERSPCIRAVTLRHTSIYCVKVHTRPLPSHALHSRAG